MGNFSLEPFVELLKVLLLVLFRVLDFLAGSRAPFLFVTTSKMDEANR